jgi:hypothetical protein
MLYRTRPEQLFPDPARYVYLIEQKKTASDWFLSILLGSLLSVTRTSLYVTRCDLAAGGQDIARYLRPPIDGSTGETAGPPARDAAPAGAKFGPRDSTDPELQATIQKRIDAARERAAAARRRAEAARQATEP